MLYAIEDFEITAVIENYKSLIWTLQYYGQGDFELVIPAEYLNVLKIGTMLSKDRTDTGFENVMVIQEITQTYDIENGSLATIRGKGLKNDLLRRRIVWDQTNLEGTVEDGIRQIITENCISPEDWLREIPNFALGPRMGYEETFVYQAFSENVADWVEQICTGLGWGWDIVIDNGQYVFSLYKGEDHTAASQDPVIFSKALDNLLTSIYKAAETVANAALIGGEGDGTDQRTASIGDGSSGMERFETYIDGSGVSSNGEIITVETYLGMLEEYGWSMLGQVKGTEDYTGTVDYNQPFKLGEDFKLGDLVTIEDVVKINTRVIEIIYSESESGIQVVPTFIKEEGV